MPRPQLLALIALITAAACNAASAGPNAIYAEQSHTEIGTYEQHLSKLCSMRLFNQENQLRHSAYFKKTRVLLGASMGNGWNLYDPTGAREFGLDYWFRNDGFSNCEVYFAVSKGRAVGGGRERVAGNRQ